MSADLSRKAGFEAANAVGRAEIAHSPAAVDPTTFAPEATAFLKALSHEGRLQILCHLTFGEKSVTELEELLGVRQAAVSQQLARLRIEGLVRTRRHGKSILYSISDPRVGRTVQLLYDLFRQPR
jgi:ArsR family transcriptional regulator